MPYRLAIPPHEVSIKKEGLFSSLKSVAFQETQKPSSSGARDRTRTDKCPRDFKSLASTYSATRASALANKMEREMGCTGLRYAKLPGSKNLLLAAICLKKTVARKYMEREMGFEPTAPTLARLCSTPELFPQMETGMIQALR